MKKFLSLLLISMMIFMVAGCSNSGNGGGGEEKAETAADANGDYHIAVSLPFTGTNASYAEYIQMGLEVALKKLEKDGWLNGDGTGKIILDYFDDKNDATEGATIAEKIVASSDPYYLLEIGSFASGVSYPCATIYRDAEVPQYALTCSKSDFLPTSGDWGFSLSVTQDTAAARVAAYDIEYLGKKNIALIYSSDSWGLETCKYYTETAEKLGVTLLASEKYEDGQQDFTSILTKIKETNPELVMCFCAENDIVLIRQQAETVGLECDWQVSSKSRTSNVLQNLGDLGENLYGIYARTKDLKDPVYIEYEELYKELYGAKFAEDNNTTQKYADQGYNCMLTTIWAIKNGGTTRQAFRDQLATLKDFPGVQGPISFGPGRRVLQTQYLSQIVRNESGELKWVNYEDILETFDVDAVAGLK